MFADIAFPTAVRQLFTFEIPEELFSVSLVGKRVWVPFRKSFAIGVVTQVHSKKPDFQTKPIRKVLDEHAILSPELLTLTNWIHKFYFCSWGEVIQAVLPAGLNFVSNTYIRISNLNNQRFTEEEKYIITELSNESSITQSEVQKRWRGTKYQKVINRLIKNGAIELWQEPNIKSKTKTVQWVDWCEDKNQRIASQFLADLTKTHKWQESLKILSNYKLPLKRSEIKFIDGITDFTFNKLIKEGWFKVIEREETEYFDQLSFQPEKLKALNSDQMVAFERITKTIQTGSFGSFLLYGITGSGKTEVYIHALKACIENNKGGIVLVPEIALTPQTVARFYQVFGDKIAVLHSRMSKGERLAEWKSIENGTKQIVIGPRSAVFAPIQNLGAIIIDEEHDSSYKQIDPAPRYHAREVAIMRAKENNAIVIMGSATPSMQALNMVKQQKAILLSLEKRHADATLPDVQIIDLTQYSGAMRGSMSVALFEAVKSSLARKEQAILLFNRRGFANYLQCETCGNIPKSPESSVSLTYHKRSNMLMCHYSGYARKLDTNCEVCGSDKLIIQGSGTQKIEEEVAEQFPDARILRFDKDSTTKKGAHERILTAFGNKEAEILVGTQLVAKGLDFPEVTTVGVIDADTEQAFPSFNASERLFQLLSQVAGRSGRGSKKGKVYIQTRQADNPAILFAQQHDHKGFAKQEMKYREELGYPPFSRLIQFNFKGKEEHKVIQSARLMERVLQQLLPKHDILGPSAGVISWLNGMYFWELYLKIETDRGANFLEKLLETIMLHYETSNSYSSTTVRVNINVDAQR